MTNKNIKKIPIATIESINAILINYDQLMLPINNINKLLTIGLHFLFPDKIQYKKQSKIYLSNKHSKKYDAESINSMLITYQKRDMRRQLHREIRRRGTYTTIDYPCDL